jgi:multiple sugar transport system permease protein
VYIYNQAFSGSYLYNRAAAASLIMFIIIAILSSFLFFIMRDKDSVLQRKRERKMRMVARAKAREVAV